MFQEKYTFTNLAGNFQVFLINRRMSRYLGKCVIKKACENIHWKMGKYNDNIMLNSKF